jgi:hypothetical protein
MRSASSGVSVVVCCGPREEGVVEFLRPGEIRLSDFERDFRVAARHEQRLQRPKTRAPQQRADAVVGQQLRDHPGLDAVREVSQRNEFDLFFFHLITAVIQLASHSPA